MKRTLILLDILYFTPPHLVLDKHAGGPRSASVTCLATDARITADPGVASSIQARSHTVIFLPSAESFKKGCCQLQAKVCELSTGLSLVKACPGKSVP